MLIMSLITLSFALLISTVLAAPHPAPNPQYGLVPAAPSTLSPSITAMPTTPTSLPNSTLLPSSNSTSSLPQPTTPSLAPNRQAGVCTRSITSPTPLPNKPQVYICNDANWAGKCTYYTSSIGAAPEDCTVLDGSASSIGPDEGFTCWFYTCVCFRLDVCYLD
jgi:hypothetical protein